jgi:PEP-CTERM motif-containing protein
MKQLGLLCLAIAFSTPAAATTVLFSDSTGFQTAAPTATLIESFEDSSLALRGIALPSYTGPGNEITFTPLAGDPTPNVFLASSGFTNFGLGLNPTTSVVLTTSGNEDFVGTLASPVFGLGFDVLLNDSPLTISFFNGVTLLGTLTFDDPVVPGDNLAFAGITSTTGVTSFRLTATNGDQINTGVDNIYTQVVQLESAVPEPSTWLMMLFGFGALGLAMRKARNRGSTDAALG